MSARRYPIAGLLNIGVTAILWLSIAMFVFGIVVLGIGIMAEMSGGELSLPFGIAYSDDVSLGGFLVALAALVAAVPGIVFICDQLKRILSTLEDGEPFVPENAGRLVRIAIAVALIELARYAIAILAAVLLQNDPDFNGVKLSINLAAWVAVAALFILSQVFAEGTRLREEEKMTI